MARRIRVAPFAAMALLGSGLACSGGGDSVPEIAAFVEAEEIPSSETEDLLLQYLESPNGKALQQTQEFDKKDVAQTILSFQIKNEYLRHVAKKEGVKLTEAQARDALDLSQAAPEKDLAESGVRDEELKQAFSNGRLSQAIAQKQFPDAVVSETQLKNAYEEKKSQFDQSWKIKMGLGVFRTIDIAAKAREELAGDKAFDEILTQLNGKGGVTDFTPLSPGPPEFIEAIGQLQKGETTEPFQLALDAWAIGYAVEREDLPALTFEQVKESLRDILADRDRKDRFDEWFFKKLKNAKVKVDGHYGKWDPSTGNVV